jgi:C-terminal processing protease CtpA/Prc
MSRIAMLATGAALCLCSGIVSAQAPDFKLGSVETRRKTVEITSVDPKGLAYQMGIKVDDTILRIGNTRITTKEECKKALESLRGEYEIEVQRVVGSGKDKRIERPVLKGEIRRRADDSGNFYIQKRP